MCTLRIDDFLSRTLEVDYFVVPNFFVSFTRDRQRHTYRSNLIRVFKLNKRFFFDRLFQVDKDKVASIIALALRKQEGTSPVNSHSGNFSQDLSNDNSNSHEHDRRSKGSQSITGSYTGIGEN